MCQSRQLWLSLRFCPAAGRLSVRRDVGGRSRLTLDVGWPCCAVGETRWLGSLLATRPSFRCPLDSGCPGLLTSRLTSGPPRCSRVRSRTPGRHAFARLPTLVLAAPGRCWWRKVPQCGRFREHVGTCSGLLCGLAPLGESSRLREVRSCRFSRNGVGTSHGTG